MAFVPRIFDTILLDMIAHVRANTTITDFTVGSVARTLLEAAALEDDEQYHQMVQLLEAFSINRASGSDLDEKAADYNLTRLTATNAFCRVKFTNEALTKTVLQFDVTGGTTLVVEDSTEFPIPGATYTIRIGEGTANVEDVTVSANNTNSNTFTVSALANTHSAGARVSEVPGGGDVDLNAGIFVQVPAQGDQGNIQFETVEKAVLIDGNYESTLSLSKAAEEGSSSNVAVGRVTQFVSSPPYAGAGVTNVTAAVGGSDREIDSVFRRRLKDRLNALSRGTIRAIEGLIRGIVNAETGQSVVSANLVENFTTGEHILYIDDGTGFTPDKVILARSQLNGAIGSGAASVTLDDTSSFPNSGFVILSPNDPNQAELIEYSSKGGSNSLSFVGLTVNSHDDNDEVLLADVLPLAEEGQNFFRLTHFPVQRNSYEIYDNSSGQFTKRAEGTDYFLNRTNGELQYFGSGLPAGTQVLVNYAYFTGLVALAQKVVNGDRDNPVFFPGIAAGGVIIYVGTPVIRQITIVASISVEEGVDEDTVKENVQQTIEVYVDSLRIGDNMILARIIDRVMDVQGVANVKIQVPSSDVIILEDELPRAFDSNGSSLVTVL